MINVEDFKKSVKEIEKSIWENYVDENGKADPIIDGIIDIDEYLSSAPKILWILKEPHDEIEDGLAAGGGWKFSDDFLGKEDYYKKLNKSKATWNPIVYTSFSILNGFKNFSELDDLTDNPLMYSVVKKIAVINVKKLPGFTKTPNFSIIKKSYDKNKEILHQQIELFNPDIIIGGSTLHLFFDYLKISQNDLLHDEANYAIKNSKLYITAYHPAQTEISQEKYVNEIVNIAEKYWHNR